MSNRLKELARNKTSNFTEYTDLSARWTKKDQAVAVSVIETLAARARIDANELNGIMHEAAQQYDEERTSKGSRGR